MELNEVVAALGVPKRRLYDITNVLEGVGLVTRLTKNNVQWNGPAAAISLGGNDSEVIRDKIVLMRRQLGFLEKEEADLDLAIKALRVDSVLFRYV